MKISKEEFIKTMQGIQKQLAIDINNHKAFSTIFPNDFISDVQNILYDTVIELLEYLTEDNSEWIQYYIYELDFGNENWRLKVYDVDDKEISLTTIEDLWNLLVQNYKENHDE